ncbi:hypothetical protein TIFTF001_015848 [Ficus carica]|uniref:Uncharacterized protein n=1 Tax=Ficus carica TaxID=3494 RepID=A0AA88A579_FICCA|nr:hypothetical protein TIFTF001_015848 [Ficus carica]
MKTLGTIDLHGYSGFRKQTSTVAVSSASPSRDSSLRLKCRAKISSVPVGTQPPRTPSLSAAARSSSLSSPTRRFHELITPPLRILFS